MTSKHLSKHEKIKLGSYYTPKFLVDKTYELISKNNIISNQFVDTSCGYGEFLREDSIGFDIDEKSVVISTNRGKNVYEVNSLLDIDFINSKLSKCSVIVGNPPYNNFSSIYKKNSKGEFIGDLKYKSRDLGISFLRSYVDIKSDFVCVIHPLSYLIKESNFNQLKDFKNSFKLIDSFVFPSTYFEELKNKTPFPIGIFIYIRDCVGMSFNFIKNYLFNIEDMFRFKINDFDYIDDYTTKYKDNNVIGNYKHFQTLRDINALSRNATWLSNESYNSIKVTNAIEYLFESLSNLKKVYSRNKDKYWFVGNLSPIVIKDDVLRLKVSSEKDYEKLLESIINRGM